MTYDAEKARLGRQPFCVAELVLDFCANTYGVAPCTASGPAGSECYNTRNTSSDCQDTANFVKSSKTYTLCSQELGAPVGTNMFPCIVGAPKFKSTVLRAGAGMSLRSEVQLTVADFPHHDRGIDPYVSTRPYIPVSQGTFFGKLFARNTYYVGRLIYIKAGYISAAGYNAADFESRLYVIDSIDGPFYGNGAITYRLTCLDMLHLAKNDKVQIPAPSDATLNADITNADASLTLASNTTLTDFPTGGGTVAIGDEWADYTSRTSYTLSGLTRGQHGTQAKSHSTGDGVQAVKHFTGDPVQIIDEILTTYAGIDGDTYIPYDAGRTTPTGTPDEWDNEETNWLAGIALDAYIGTPTGAMKLLDELCAIFQIDIWWDEVGQKIKLKVNAPPLGNAAITALGDDGNLIADKTSSKDLPDKRISRVVLHYDKINLANVDKVSNYARHHFETDTSVESADTYNEVRLKEIFSRWLNGTNDSAAIQSAQRIIARLGIMPKQLMFSLDARDNALKVGDLCDITTSKLQGADGADNTVRFQIIQRTESKLGHQVDYIGQNSSYTYNTRYAFVADNATPVYTSASAAQKLANAFVAPDSGLFSDGGTPYLII